MKIRFALPALVLLLAVALSACATPAPTPTPTPTPAPTETPLPTDTPRPSPTATVPPTATPTPPPRRVSLGLTVAARRAPLVMRLEGARLEGDALTLDLAFVNTGARDLQGPTAVSGGDAVLVADGKPQSPRDVTPTLATDLAPGPTWRVGEANTGRLTFARPVGSGATLRLPGFPTVQIDLAAGSAAALADDGNPLPTPTPDAQGEAVAAARAVLRGLGEAVRAGDEAAFQRLVGPEAAAYLGQPDPFAFARAVPFARFELDLFAVDLARPGSVERREGQPLAVRGALVTLVFALSGAEQNWFRYLLTVDFERSEDGWRLARIVGDPPPFWTQGLVATTRSPHFLAFHRSGEDVGDIVAAAEQAHAALSERLGDLVEPVNILVAPDSVELYGRVTGQNGHDFIGQARFNNLLTPTGIIAVGRVLYINEAVFRGGAVQNTRLQTVQHELTHLTLSGWSRPWTPPWLVEGAAGVFAGEPNRPALDQFLRTRGPNAISLADLTGIDTLEQAPVSLSVAYPYAAAVSETLIEEYGQERYLDFYRAFTEVSLAEARQAAGDGASVSLDRFRQLQRSATDQSLARVYGLTLAELEARTEARLMRELK